MKRLTILFLFIAAAWSAAAQTSFSPVPTLDKSPMDMVYFPANYPILKIQEKVTTPPIVRAIYSRPQTGNRAIFGELIEYGKVWRLGANEATEIEFFKDVKVGGKKVPKGRYTLYALINPTEWTMILNKETDTWGAFNYNDKKDVARVTVPVQPLSQAVDAFGLYFEKSGTNNLALVVEWDKVKVAMPIALQ